MKTPEITRCGNCTGECNEHFIDTARKLLWLEDSHAGDEMGQDLDHLLQFRLSSIIQCDLAPSQIIDNLEGLTEGRMTIHG